MEILLPFFWSSGELFQGSFGLGMKQWSLSNGRPGGSLRYHCYDYFSHCMGHSCRSQSFQVIANAPSEALFLGMLFGFLWGVGGILFGKSLYRSFIDLWHCNGLGRIGRVHYSLLQVENAFSNPTTTYVIIAVIIMLVGVALTAKAGIERDKLTGDTNDPSNISKGIFIAVSCGVLSALLNVGFANATPVAWKLKKWEP